jgi:hypothetical protein
MYPFEYDQVYECTSVINSTELEHLTAVTTKMNILNTTTPKAGTPVRTSIVQEPPVSMKGSLAWKDSDRTVFLIYPFATSILF